MTDTKKLYSDYFKFWKRFCYWCKTNGYGKPEYISVIEPQGSGAWHVHSFFIWSEKAPFIPNDKMAELWGQGFTKTKQPQDCDNVGAYFSAYLGDMPLDEVQHMSKDKQLQALSASGQVDEKEFADDAGAVKKKKFVKGGRLFLYPPGMNIIRSSKGVKQPEVEYMSREKAQKKSPRQRKLFLVRMKFLMMVAPLSIEFLKPIITANASEFQVQHIVVGLCRISVSSKGQGVPLLGAGVRHLSYHMAACKV